MIDNDLKVGAVYMVRGGHILRYQGIYESPLKPGFNPTPKRLRPIAHAFGPVIDEGPFDPPAGASIAAEDALYEITAEKLPMLRFRLEQLQARKLPTEDVDYLITSLEKPA